LGRGIFGGPLTAAIVEMRVNKFAGPYKPPRIIAICQPIADKPEADARYATIDYVFKDDIAHISFEAS
jgi:hypothetical protein